MKRQRELREITLREISDSTKISVRILEAIENNNYKVLPGGVFNRNFIRAYAEFIGLDPESVVRKYVQQSEAIGPELPDAILSMTSKSTERMQESRASGIWVYLLVIALLAAILLVAWLVFRPASTSSRNLNTIPPAQTHSAVASAHF